MPVQRLIIGALAVVMIVLALWLNVFDPAAGHRYPAFAGGTVRMALVLSVLWLAIPDVVRGPAAMLYMLGAVVAVALLFKSGKNALRILIPAMGVLGVLGFLRRFTTAKSAERKR